MKNKEKGSVTLETTLVLPFFLFMFLLIFGLFSVVGARNQISHALVQSSKSMSLDAYYLERVASAGESGTKFWKSLGDAVLDIVRLDNDKHFSARTDWYSGNAGATVAKDRFVGYLSGGDEAEADEILDALGVIDGLDGMQFKTEIADDVMTVTINYTLQFVFDVFDMGKIPMEQSIKVKLWK